MCALLSAWLCLLLSLMPLEIQSRGLTLQRPHRHRLTFPRTPKYPKSSHPTILPTESDLSAAVDNEISQEDRHVNWRALLHKEPPPKLSDPWLDQSRNVLPEAPVWQRGSRGRRHANASGRGHGHGHLMRVGCVLGTCQVQNLSHRLYQLIGQSGREDSSPINPRSPHSFG
ncbi:protein ADM2 [Mugil cephalus]|uniref:protein ADM2 n=1 Tax=Mugil cephalus TaxID=48193 RepID=UPI001FB66F63|nr:protein ADM2 [Mugil cephalus]